MFVAANVFGQTKYTHSICGKNLQRLCEEFINTTGNYYYLAFVSSAAVICGLWNLAMCLAAMYIKEVTGGNRFQPIDVGTVGNNDYVEVLPNEQQRNESTVLPQYPLEQNNEQKTEQRTSVELKDTEAEKKRNSVNTFQPTETDTEPNTIQRKSITFEPKNTDVEPKNNENINK